MVPNIQFVNVNYIRKYFHKIKWQSVIDFLPLIPIAISASQELCAIFLPICVIRGVKFLTNLTINILKLNIWSNSSLQNSLVK
jgi:hypothetical protein